MGADLLSRRQRDRAPDLGLDRVHRRAQALLHDLRRALHDELVPVRAGAEPPGADRVPRAPGARRRRAAAVGAVDPRRHVPRGEAGHGVRLLRVRGRRRPGDRAHARRVDHGQLLLAVDLLHQHSGRDRLAPHEPRLRRGPAALRRREGAARARGVERGLRRARARGARARLAADHARQGRARGLVRVAPDPGDGDARGVSASSRR